MVNALPPRSSRLDKPKSANRKWPKTYKRKHKKNSKTYNYNQFVKKT